MPADGDGDRRDRYVGRAGCAVAAEWAARARAIEVAAIGVADAAGPGDAGPPQESRWIRKGTHQATGRWECLLAFDDQTSRFSIAAALEAGENGNRVRLPAADKRAIPGSRVV